MQILKNVMGTPVTLASDLIQVQQDRQCTYNVTLWNFRVTIVAVEIKQYILCVLLRYMSLSTI
jgi:hypothetical protein